MTREALAAWLVEHVIDANPYVDDTVTALEELIATARAAEREHITERLIEGAEQYAARGWHGDANALRAAADELTKEIP